MSEPKRYAPAYVYSNPYSDEREPGMEEDGGGDYVSYDDYAALRSQLAAAEKDNTRLTKGIEAALNEHEATKVLLFRIEELKRERDEARRERDGVIAERDNYLRMLKAAIKDGEHLRHRAERAERVVEDLHRYLTAPATGQPTRWTGPSDDWDRGYNTAREACLRMVARTRTATPETP